MKKSPMLEGTDKAEADRKEKEEKNLEALANKRIAVRVNVIVAVLVLITLFCGMVAANNWGGNLIGDGRELTCDHNSPCVEYSIIYGCTAGIGTLITLFGLLGAGPRLQDGTPTVG